MDDKAIRKTVSKKKRNQAINFYKNGQTYKYISSVLGLTTGTVGSILKKANVARRKNAAGFPVPNKDPNDFKNYGIGYWHMNLVVRSIPLQIKSECK
tara:strand:+ start:298 stop:588 length:291 start_codon:yes stop_codon:yes gene_type:complete